jgi:hypothetical protein
MSAPPFSKDTPNKMANGIDVSGKYTLTKTDDTNCRVAIADEPINAKFNGKKLFCVRVDKAGSNSSIVIGFTPTETFDSRIQAEQALFGYNGFTGCGLCLYNGKLFYPVDKCHNIIDDKISEKAKEIIVILTISNNGKKKEIRFLCDGQESKSSDVSEHLEGDLLFPAIVLGHKNEQITTIPLNEIKTRTPEIENLINEDPCLRFTSNALRQVLEMQHVLLQQAEVQVRAVMAKMKF